MFNSVLAFPVALLLGLFLSAPGNAGAATDPEPAGAAVAGSAQADGENDLWIEVKRGGTRDDYQAYLDQYPKGKYSPLAHARLKKMDMEEAKQARLARDAAAQQALQEEQAAWDSANKDASEAGYNNYLSRYPAGLFAPLVPARLARIKREAVVHEEEALWNRALDAGSREAVQAYLEKYPAGRYVQEARQKDEDYQRVPARPQLPVVLSEGVWRTLEASAAYRNLPQPRTVKVSYQTSDQIEYTGSKSSTLPRPKASSKSVTKELTPLGGKCWESRQRFSYSQNNSSSSIDVYACGMVPLTVVMNGKPASMTRSLDLQGSLFPMRIGAEQSDRSSSSYLADAKYDSTMSNKCRVIGKGLASEVNPQLTGVAWTVSCEMNLQMPGAQTPMNRTTVTEDYFLEDLGVFLSQIGEIDLVKKKYVLPAAGSQTAIVAEGEYGSRSTSTYRNFDWTVGK